MTLSELVRAADEASRTALPWKAIEPMFAPKQRATVFQMRRESATGKRLGTVSASYDGKAGRYEAEMLDGEKKVYGELVEAMTAVDGQLEADGYKLVGRVIWR